MIVGVHHIGVAVRSIESVMPLYVTAAGLRRVDIDGGRTAVAAAAHGGGVVEDCMLAGPNAYVRLHQRRQAAYAQITEPSPINRPGIRHLCIQSHDCAGLERAVYSAGGDLIAPPLDLGTGNQYAYARDRERNIIEIEGLPYAPVTQPTWIGHVAIVTEEMDSTLALFAELLGVTATGRRVIGPTKQIDRMGGLSNAQLEGAWLPASNMLLEFWEFKSPRYEGLVGRAGGPETGYSHIAFETDDLAGDSARLFALGCIAEEGVGTLKPLQSLFMRTPDGIMLELVQPRDTAFSLAALDDIGVCARVEANKHCEGRYN